MTESKAELSYNDNFKHSSSLCCFLGVNYILIMTVLISKTVDLLPLSCISEAGYSAVKSVKKMLYSVSRVFIVSLPRSTGKTGI